MTCCRLPVAGALVAWTVLGLTGAGGCGVLNPALVSSLGVNPAGSIDPPEGYVVILVMNQSATSVQVDADIAYQDGTSKVWTIGADPVKYTAFALDCRNLESIHVTAFRYAGLGGVVETPAALGTLVVGQAVNCGGIVAVTAAGTPPGFSVQVIP